jgi:NADPH:quinone reductase-like Zn-dependent oxidoreductase
MKMSKDTMHAIVVEKYGGINQLVARDVSMPGPPKGEDLLVR